MDLLAPFPGIIIMQKLGRKRTFMLGLFLIGINNALLSTFGYVNLEVV